MKVLITGGAGAVGRAFSERLLSDDHDVVVYDLEGNGLPAGAQFAERDVRDFRRLAAAAKVCDHGIDLAALTGASSAEDILSVNTLGAYGYCLAASAARFRNAVIASSAPVHLAASPEDDSLLLRTSGGEDHVYDLSKALQEVIGRDFHSHGLPVTCLRFGHIVLGGEEATVPRSAPLRDEEYCRGGWVAIEDVVDACAAALEAVPTPARFEVMNIVGARSARDRFRVAAAEARLRIKLRHDFAAFE